MSNCANTDTSPRNFVIRQTGVPNVTGDGTVVTCTYDTNLQGSGTDIATGVFTADTNGIYLFSCYGSLTNVNAGNASAIFTLVTTLRTYTYALFNDSVIRSPNSIASMGGMIIAPMNSGDIANMTVSASNSGLIIGYTATLEVMRIS